MNKRIRIAIAAATIVGGFTMTQAGSASAAHCVAPVGEPSSPGFSYFGQDGRKDGDPTPGASVCRERTGSPSTRAPGQNKP